MLRVVMLSVAFIAVLIVVMLTVAGPLDLLRYAAAPVAGISCFILFASVVDFEKR
jgi:hypothetical protein